MSQCDDESALIVVLMMIINVVIIIAPMSTPDEIKLDDHDSGNLSERGLTQHCQIVERRWRHRLHACIGNTIQTQNLQKIQRNTKYIGTKVKTLLHTFLEIQHKHNIHDYEVKIQNTLEQAMHNIL